MNGAILATFSEKDGPKMVLCTSKDGVGSVTGCRVYRTVQDGTVYETSERVVKRLDGLIKSVCLRALCCEYVGPRSREGKIAFRCGSVYALAVVFQVLDKKARGLHRAFALIFVDFELSTLMRNVSFIASTLRQIASSIKQSARAVFQRESRRRGTHSPQSEQSLRPLCQLLGKSDLHVTLHQSLTWLLHTTACYISVTVNNHFPDDVSGFPFKAPEPVSANEVYHKIEIGSPNGRRTKRSLEEDDFNTQSAADESTATVEDAKKLLSQSTDNNSSIALGVDEDRRRQLSIGSGISDQQKKLSSSPSLSPVGSAAVTDTAALLKEINDNINSELQEQVPDRRESAVSRPEEVIQISIPRGEDGVVSRRLSFKCDSEGSPTHRQLSPSDISSLTLRGIRSALIRFEVQNGLPSSKLFKRLIFHIVSGDQVVVTSESEQLASKTVQILSVLLPAHQSSTIDLSEEYVPVYKCRLLGMVTRNFLDQCSDGLPEGCVHLELGVTAPMMALLERNCERWESNRYNEHNCAISTDIDAAVSSPNKPSSELLLIQRIMLRFSRLSFLFTSLARSTRADRSSFDFTEAERCNILTSLSIHSKSPFADSAVLRCLGAGHPSRKALQVRSSMEL
eukprot:TRINITY_DN1732_c1_g1_i1.p1 TRINITY_DN1732_c1_g1~~TRINITY_DN1732_c1_g1_i1.p1  ORF type:complete len:624 (+),score=78.50 TRINITY_DN1732_c1_g1_i1:95-1966(+)